MFRVFKIPLRIWLAIIVAIATLIAFEIGGNIVAEKPFVGIIFFILGSILFIFLYHLRRAFLNVYLLYRHPCEPHKGLIMLISTPFPQLIKSNNNWIVQNGATVVTLSGNLKNDIDNLEKAKSMSPPLRWNWQQLLRALVPHIDSLKSVYLLGSPEPGGSYRWLDAAEEIIKMYKNNVEVKRYKNPVDFEDFDELLKIIINCIECLREEGIKDKDIIIDITGGTKTASIAGAIATLNTRVTFQYVSTNPDPKTGEYTVWAYDVAVQSPISI